MPLLEHALSIYRRTLPGNNSHALDAEDLLARAHEQKGDIEAATKIYSRTYPHWIGLFPYEPALVHCRIIASFFKRHGPMEQAQAVHSAIDEFEKSKTPK
jgi:hypothetical protein